MGLYAAYAFNEGTGSTVTDHSGNGRDMTVSGTGNTWPAGVNYPAAFLAGASGAGALWNNGSADPGLSGDVTVMCWAQTANGATAQSFAAGVYSTPSTARMALYSYRSLSGTASSPQLTARNSASTVFSIGANGTSADASWHHFAAVYHSAGTVDLYLDGTEVVTGASVTSAIGTTVQYLGVGSLIAGNGAQSAVQDLRVFDTALTGADIATFMATPVVSSGTPRTASASLTVTPSLSAAGHAARPRPAALTVTPALAASRAAAHVLSAALVVAPSLSAAGVPVHPRTASLVVTPALAAARSAAHAVPASLTVRPALVAAASHAGSGPDLTVYPDVAHAVCDLLRSLVTGADTETPADLQEQLPWIRVTRTGGQSDRVTDVASVVVDVFASGATEALGIARQVLQRLIRGPFLSDVSFRTAHGQVDRARVTVGPALLPPTDSDNLRLVTASYNISVRR